MTNTNAEPNQSPQLFTVSQVAARWQCDAEKVSRMFSHQPGVMDIGIRPDVRRRKRGYKILRIPLQVLEEVERKLTVGGRDYSRFLLAKTQP